jgi:hypothetical protein
LAFPNDIADQIAASLAVYGSRVKKQRDMNETLQDGVAALFVFGVA